MVNVFLYHCVLQYHIQPLRSKIIPISIIGSFSVVSVDSISADRYFQQLHKCVLVTLQMFFLWLYSQELQEFLPNTSLILFGGFWL
jgi:hypothetical protein